MSNKRTLPLPVAIVFAAALAVFILVVAMSCAPSARESSTPSRQGWHAGPGDVYWVDMGDGTRCYQYKFDNSLSCVRMP